MDSSKNEETVKQIFTEYLKENKFRRTPERFAILKTIYSINGCFEIETLLKKMEEEKFRVSRATVYNTIALLTNANLVIHHQFGSTSKYEKCFGNEKSHMICTNCGKVVETTNINIKETITANIKKFHLTHYSLYIYGLCNKCHQTAKRRKMRKRQ
ncbi:MAG: transcriptional repressor [Bacteroidaceae bacterium]|nr:transcriptional repressor [Bacteroidaceae bacterium]